MPDDLEKDKLDALGARIRRATAFALAKAQPREEQPGMSVALRAVRVGSDFVATIVVCGLIGWGIDAWALTKPWAMLGMLFVGFVLGFWTLVRGLQNESKDLGKSEDQGGAKSGKKDNKSDGS